MGSNIHRGGNANPDTGVSCNAWSDFAKITQYATVCTRSKYLRIIDDLYHFAASLVREYSANII
jgi:hypothetical protein